MPMSKKEQAKFAELEKELAVRKAFRWYDPVEPDVPPGERNNPSKGWLSSFWRDEPLTKASSGPEYHYSGADAWETLTGHRCDSQGALWLYSTAARALRAAQAEACREFADTIVRLEKRIAELDGADEAE